MWYRCMTSLFIKWGICSHALMNACIARGLKVHSDQSLVYRIRICGNHSTFFMLISAKYLELAAGSHLQGSMSTCSGSSSFITVDDVAWPPRSWRYWFERLNFELPSCLGNLNDSFWYSANFPWGWPVSVSTWSVFTLVSTPVDFVAIESETVEGRYSKEGFIRLQTRRTMKHWTLQVSSGCQCTLHMQMLPVNVQCFKPWRSIRSSVIHNIYYT